MKNWIMLYIMIASQKLKSEENWKMLLDYIMSYTATGT
jgi:hypothetical protein